MVAKSGHCLKHIFRQTSSYPKHSLAFLTFSFCPLCSVQLIGCCTGVHLYSRDQLCVVVSCDKNADRETLLDEEAVL